MNQTLIDAIVKLTGKTEEEVQTKLSAIQIDDIYKLMDLVRKGDKASIIDFIDPITESAYFKRTTNEDLRYAAKFSNQIAIDGLVDWLDAENVKYNFRNNDIVVVDCPNRDFAYRLSCKAMAIKATLDNPHQTFKDMADNKNPGKVPKPRDPMAKALALPQYQPKVTPSKKGQLDKAVRKHKGRDDAMEATHDEDDVMTEGVMGMVGMGSMIPRLLTLAGRPPQDEFETSYDDVPFAEPEMQYDAPEVAQYNDEMSAITMETPGGSPIINIRCGFETILGNINDIKVSEFNELRKLVGDLQSAIDLLGNDISGK